ncbi:hypothetical protein SLE2022_096050 [Rubroshorea leprosula]
MNVDGALDEQSGVYGMGAVIPNEQGQVIAAMASKGNGYFPAAVVEAYSVKKALSWVAELGLRGVEVESDAACVVSAVSAIDRGGLSELEMIFDDCRMLLSSLDDCSVRHVRREGNSVAHELAKRALTNEDDEYWAEELPSNIMQCVAEDLRRLSLSV